MPGVLDTVRGLFSRVIRGGSAGPLPAWYPTNWFQLGLSSNQTMGGSPAVESCVSAISQTIASMPIQHWRRLPNGGQELVLSSPIAKVLRKPNSYQTRSDFILNLLRNELFNGNGYALALRDDRFQIESLHLTNPLSTSPLVAPDGSIFYQISLSDVAAGQAGVSAITAPASEVLHLRMQTPRNPLIGETPLIAAALSIDAGKAIHSHLSAFFNNMSRPSGFLKAPTPLKPETAEKLREEWQLAFSQAKAGRVAVLQGGLDWVSLTMSAVDAAIIESYRMTVIDVARVFRVPLAIIGETGGATYSNTETLIRHWLNTGLGFVVEHLELALDALFDLPPNEFIEVDLDYLLRSDFVARIDGLTKGIQGGLLSPNEARRREGLPSVEFGDEPRLQAQVVPLSFASKTPDPAAPPAPSAPSASDDPSEEDSDVSEEALTMLREMARG